MKIFRGTLWIAAIAFFVSFESKSAETQLDCNTYKQADILLAKNDSDAESDLYRLARINKQCKCLAAPVHFFEAKIKFILPNSMAQSDDPDKHYNNVIKKIIYWEGMAKSCPKKEQAELIKYHLSFADDDIDKLIWGQLIDVINSKQSSLPKTITDEYSKKDGVFNKPSKTSESTK
jgi:hypothetical protein